MPFAPISVHSKIGGRITIATILQLLWAVIDSDHGEMPEWLKEHAWKTNPATLTERYQNASSRNRFNDFRPKNPSRCEPVNVAVCQRFLGDFTQFLDSSRSRLRQLLAGLRVGKFPRAL